jgi:hypothetical protein
VEPAEFLVTIIGAGSGGAIILSLIRGMSSWLTGGAGRERARNASFSEQRNAAVIARDEMADERDEEASKRRKTEEYASLLRRQLIENGLAPGAWLNDNTIPAPPTKE